MAHRGGTYANGSSPSIYGRRDRLRTCDDPINSRALCRLSYSPIFGGPCRIRTYDPLLARQPLSQTELRALYLVADARFRGAASGLELRDFAGVDLRVA